ncbi:MAG: phospholipase D-like domain-containing protein, partial [Bdellovibrionota bacterium]|nr:phospholipase D-like domain-containing protein [Bdellovibrionota bacterium]
NFREFVHVDNLVKEGLKTSYVETYADDVLKARRVQLQHNKFFIFTGHKGEGAVFTGAGNITNAAFEKNFENFYFITRPFVYFSFRVQYHHLWNDLGTISSEMPSKLELP